jgi:hypothetical protein
LQQLARLTLVFEDVSATATRSLQQDLALIKEYVFSPRILQKCSVMANPVLITST